MDKKPSQQILAENLNRLMAQSPGLNSNHALGKRAKIAHSYIRKIRLLESEATVGILDKLAAVFGVLPFELLTDGEEVRAAALTRLMRGDPANEDQATYLPPKVTRMRPKEVAHRTRKKRSQNDSGAQQ